MTMRARPRKFDRAFKIAVMRQWDRGERTGAQLGREHSISQSVLYRWREEYRQLGDAAFAEVVEDDVTALRRRVAQLEQALGQATLENQILKRGLQLSQSRSGTR